VSESIPDLRSKPRRDAYAEIAKSAESLLGGATDDVVAMSTIAALLHHSLGFLWTGFYRVVAPGVLQVGPYQGSLGCIEIRFGKGVCGTAAAEKKTIIVRDVNDFPGHISCDSRSRSEIVVPVVNGKGNLIAILDVDSESVGAFSDADKEGLEKIVEWFKGR
jgi:L-methionine (R)-S-oxide reductase